MTNSQVVNAWILGNRGQSLNMHTDGEKLFSYNTIIAQWGQGGLQPIVNVTKYSMTTSAKHQRPLYDALNETGLVVTYVKNVPFGAHNLSTGMDHPTEKELQKRAIVR